MIPGRIPARRGLARGLAMTAAAVLAIPVAAALTVQPATAATSLRGLAEAQNRYFGTALTDGDLNNSAETNIAGPQFDMVTPGNEMKWDTTEPSNGSYNFGPGDQILSWAQAHNDRVRGHNLVWHSQLPGWVNSLPQNQVQGAMEAHITTEATHYKGKLYAWDVVNEPFNEDGSLRQDVFDKAMGTNYIADAIRTAHAADPNAKLYLNDYNIEGENAKSDGMYNLAKSLLSQGVPLNGIGLESHFIVGQVPSTMQANMQRFAALGLDVAVTELDDRIQLPASSANLQQQAADYANIVKDCLAVSRCVGISQWGVDDGNSWIPGTFPGYGAATMYDQNFQPKPAYNSTVSALGGGSTPPPPSGGALHAVGAGKCVDVPNSTTTSGTQVQIYSCDGQANQAFTHNSAGELAVTDAGVTDCLDANGKGTTNGTKVIIYPCNGQPNQQWTINSNGTITGVQSGLCLDVTGASTANGALVELWTCNGGSNQQWTLS
ncbi:glycoside hydrolase family 10 [Catenulispora acidiphila DSM 44928]|uniref:Beta-xylanase n=1 Tax=Catenulispora acidiphila (strain DSM 44928 / JCM 14897 / NBRC 102108 / NRRL B-24433 / ID139908) TaxID=479433 RepID=C7Q352_CATAD|nr:endo-1,4-beta-xylanase [Catenulispora acidiphila]ACU73788.1 glycoside hydrolase family 10 [Catenulispora acidiphila DSM 44928]